MGRDYCELFLLDTCHFGPFGSEGRFPNRADSLSLDYPGPVSPGALAVSRLHEEVSLSPLKARY